MKRWSTITLVLFAFVIGFVSTYSCGGGSSSNAADYAPLVHQHDAADITSGELSINLIPSHSHSEYAFSNHTHLAGDADTLDGMDSSDFAESSHDHDEIQKMTDAICYLSRATGISLTGYAFDADCYQYVFVTSTIYNGDFGGIASADAICQSLADSANLPGMYKAWLGSGGTSDSYYPAGGAFTFSPYPYVLVDGTVVASNWSDLTDGSIVHPIDIDENGDAVIMNTNVWTNVSIDGTASATSDAGQCNKWLTTNPAQTGYKGSVLSTISEWTNASTTPCNDFNRIYCFQQ